MPRPRDIPVIDTLIGFRDRTHAALVASEKVKWERHPAEYMFKDLPGELAEGQTRDSSIEETLEKMDEFNVSVGVIHTNDDRTADALRRYPERFVGIMPINPHLGMDAVRAIQKAHDGYGLRGISMFPSGQNPPCPINDKHWYPIYSKCVELNIPAFCTTGVPGPRIPMMPQYVGHLDEVCYDFPDLKLVMRHGAEPWVDLAVKLLLKWPNLYYSTSAFAPKYWPEEIIKFANTRGSDKVIYAGYFPMGLDLARIFREMDDVPFKDEVWPKFLHDNAARVLGLPPIAA
jgi:predicted TIM-barrel fold metal-dependent hydrolase